MLNLKKRIATSVMMKLNFRKNLKTKMMISKRRIECCKVSTPVKNYQTLPNANSFQTSGTPESRDIDPTEKRE